MRCVDEVKRKARQERGVRSRGKVVVGKSAFVATTQDHHIACECAKAAGTYITVASSVKPGEISTKAPI